jgi:hypothetical protein
MPLMRRRPLMRAAMVGGGAYVAGKHVANKQQHEAEQDAQLAEMQQPQQQYAPPPPQYAPPPQQYAPPPPEYAPAPPAPEPAAAVDPIEALTQAKALLDSGVLTQEEFDAQKRRILGG